MISRLRLTLTLLVFLAALPQAFATLADCGHRPFGADVPNADGNPTPRRQYREPYVEISNTPATPTTVTVYTVVKKFNNPFGTANQTGGTLFYKGASQGVWQSVGLGFHANEGDFQYWKASFSSASFAANEVIQYYFLLTFDSGAENTYIYAGTGFGDLASQTTNVQSTAAGNSFTIRNRPAWIFHASNRVISGNDVVFWAKVGYIGDQNNLTTRWATNGAVYYTTDGSAPTGSLAVASGTSVAVPFTYDHPESNAQGSPSIAGSAMWWMANGQNLLGSVPFGGTIRYRIGFWNSSNNEEKFADHNAGTNNTTFSFTNGTVGDPALTVNGVNGNYTTTHVFIDETLAQSSPFTILFSPGQPNLTAVEVFTNLNRRDKVTTPYTDGNGLATEEGIEPFNGDLISAGDDSHYYKAYTMTATGNPGEYSVSLGANKTGAYRLTTRWKVNGDPNWRYYTNIAAGRRDHAIVVSPVTARNINLYEANVFNLDASGTAFTDRGTLEDMYDAPNAPHAGNSHWSLTYLQNLGCNWLWFQPIHPITEEAQQGHDPGSPYSVRNFFDVNPYMTTLYNSGAGPNDPTNRDNARLAFSGFVSAANNAGVGVMLDAPFNHSAPDCEVSSQGTGLFGSNPSPGAFFRDVEARFYSRTGNYAMRAFNSSSYATAPDRGDFGKWDDVRDVFFGRYAALVDINPDNNGNYLNEQDWFDYSVGNDGLSGSGNGHFDGVTQNVWRYFSNYTLYWLSQTGVPLGTNLPDQTAKGIGALRADFGQGLPPQLWEYIINKTRTRKWNFVFMAESLDGGAVTYRSNRHFDILNENIVFPLKSASNASDYRNIFEGRRSAYGQSLVLMNNMSHDEEAFADPWQAVVRYGVCSTVDGVPLIFPGQELGISTAFGYSRYETNFGKNIADFKDFNSLVPAWNDNNYGNDQLYPVYQGMAKARLSSPALRSQNRYFLNEDGNSQAIFAVAKYEVKNGSPANTDVVLAFANTNRDTSPQGNFHINQDTDSNGVNDYGIKVGRIYDVKNIAAYTGITSNRRNIFLNRKTGSQLLTDGIFVTMNRVPTDDATWATSPFEAQYLKVYDVTPPSTPPGAPTLQRPNAYGYALDSGGVTYSWAAVGPDSEGIQPIYKVTVQVNNTQPFIFFTTSTSNTFQVPPGNTLTIFVQAINPNDIQNSGTPGAMSATVIWQVLSATGDNDGDGITNGDEDAAGTNPFDVTSNFEVANVTKPDGANITITWKSVSGKSYYVEGAATPGGTYQQIAGSNITASGNMTSETVATGANHFFHVVVVP